ncbi:MAG: hypothetical protein CMJ83_06025, partial [Planctomycetes bacterium]|nr:hypothetical protein [Planctomycetota bacterium]
SRLRTAFPLATSLGCTAEGTIGDGRELERQASVSLLAGSLPGVDFRPFRVTQDTLDDDEWVDRLGPADGDPTFLVLGDPFSLDVRRFLSGTQESHPGRPVIGGMASGAHQPGDNRLLADGAVHADGLVGVAITGDVAVDSVVSQGCRPIGEHYVVTQGEANILRGLRNQPAMKVLQEVASGLPPQEQSLLQHGIFVGCAIDEYRSSFARGDFLIHSIVHADPETGTLAISGEVRPGTTVQFHVRDADSADEDLREMLARVSSGVGSGGDDPSYAGAALFSCNGRGTRMWDTPGHDVGVLRTSAGAVPVAGFFCAGELGPIGGRNFIHGYTASVALFRPRTG